MTVADVLARLRGRRLILVDGPTGSGKSTLAAELLTALTARRPGLVVRGAAGHGGGLSDSPPRTGQASPPGKARAVPSPACLLVPMDDLYDGWSGLVEGIRQAQRLVDDLAAGRPAGYRRFDWLDGRYAERVSITPPDVLIVEGCGAGSVLAPATNPALLVWVETDPAEALRRAVARDGEGVREQLLAWQRDEARVFAEDRTRDRADLRLRT